MAPWDIGSAHLHDEAACGEEEGRPTWVCRGCYQDLTRLQVGLTRVQDHTRFLRHHPARSRRAAQDTIRPGCVLRYGSRLGTVGEQEARHVPAT